MNSFATPEWDSNPIADKTCNELFKGRKASPNQNNKKKKDRKNKKSEIKAGRIEKTKTKQQKPNVNLKNVKSIKSVKQLNLKKFKPNDTSSRLESFQNNKKQNKTFSPQNLRANKNKNTEKEESENNGVKKQKPKVTHQTLFNQTPRKNRPKTNAKPYTTKNLPELKEKIASKKKLKRLKKKQFKANQKTSEDQEEKQENDETNEGSISINKNIKKTKGKQMQKFKEKIKATLEEGKSFLTTTLNKKQRAALPLRERMLEKLKGARFRYLNEQMYTTEGKDAKKYFDHDQDAYKAYHDGYKQQVAQWPLNPLNVIIEKIKKLPKTHIVADFGCGEAKLAKSITQTVHSFDLVAVDESVTACDMAHVPLTDGSVNVVVFCLSLMGTNLKDYLLEAHRVLKIGGLLKIAEVESRFDSVDDFIRNVQSFGFAKTAKDLSHDLFCFLDFVKKESNVKQKKKLPNVSLNPCLYKKR